MLRSLVGSEMCIRDSLRPRGDRWRADDEALAGWREAVSYTHLTLPTSDLVYISVVAVSLKKKITYFFFQAEDGIRDAQESRGLGDVYKRQSPAPGRPMARRRRGARGMAR